MSLKLLKLNRGRRHRMSTQTLTRILNASRAIILFLMLLSVLLAGAALRFAGIDEDHQPAVVVPRSWFPPSVPVQTLQLQSDDLASSTLLEFTLQRQWTAVSSPKDGISLAATDPAESATSISLARAVALFSIGTVVGALVQYVAIRLVEAKSADRQFP